MSERPLLRVDERPRTALECLLYGWQHTLVDISPFVLPLGIAGVLGMDAAATTRFIGFGLVAMGAATLLQTTIGNRLPLVQGPSATLAATMTGVAAQLGAGAMWGAAFVGALLEAALGALRLLGPLRRLMPPALSGAVIVVIALQLAQLAAQLAIGDGTRRNLLFAGAVLLVVALLQLVPFSALRRGAIFIAIWLVGLGLGSALGAVDWRLVEGAPWFAWPALFPYGGPGFGWEIVPAAVVVVFVGYLGSLVESLGDYAAICETAEEPLTERHSNRGIFAEGLGSAVATALGGLPCTTYTQNIGIVAATRVASRLVVQVAAGFLVLYGLCPKFGALLVAMPRATLGGVFLLVCALILIAGLHVIGQALAAPSGARHGLLVGLTLVGAFAIPPQLERALGKSWLDAQPAVVALVLSNGVVLALLIGVACNLALIARARASTN